VERIGGSGCKLDGALMGGNGVGATIGDGGVSIVAGLPECAIRTQPPKNPMTLPVAIIALRYFWNRFIV
jgi:hypothetical protein